MRKMLALFGATILALLLNGCSKDTASTPAKANTNNTSSSFQDKLSDTFMPAIKVKIVTDPKTGVISLSNPQKNYGRLLTWQITPLMIY